MTALVQARKRGAFTAEHEAFWAAARAAHGDAAGTRELIEVLLLHRHLAPGVIAGLRAVATVGASCADVVAVEARKAASQRRIGTRVPSDGAAAGVGSGAGGQPDRTALDRCRGGDRRAAAGPAAVADRRCLRAMTEQATQAAVDQACRSLRLPTIRTRVEEITAAVQREQLTYWGFAKPNINPAPIHTLARCEWVRKGDPLCLIGTPGPGKPTCSSRWAPRPRRKASRY